MILIKFGGGGGLLIHSIEFICLLCLQLHSIVVSKIIKPKNTSQIRENHIAQYVNCSKSRPAILLYQTKIGMTR